MAGSGPGLCLWGLVTFFVTPRAVAHQAPLSMAFTRQEYWSGLSFPPPGDLPVPGIKPVSLELTDGLFTTELPHLGSPDISFAAAAANGIISFFL